MIDPKIAIVFGGDLGSSKKYPYVDVDNVKGGQIATDHLLSVGCKRILTITGDLRLQSGRDRLEGYEKSLIAAGIKIDEKLILQGDYTQSKAENLMKNFLNSKIKFDGIFAANDQSAVGAIKILTMNGIQVPNKIKVVGFDDSPIAAIHSPTISSIRQPIRELGSEVATSLLETISGKKVNNKTIDVKLIKRQSSQSKN